MTSPQAANLVRSSPPGPGPIPFELRWPVEPPLPLALRERICCIIPCYNVGGLCEAVIADCIKHVGRIIAVDDGSTDDTPRHLEQARLIDPERIEVVTLAKNRGKGVALMEGFSHALRFTRCDVLVTIDGDGQHRAGDIPRVARPALNGSADFVISQRKFPKNVPSRSRMGNSLSAAILSSFYRHAPRDTQCGLRAHTRALMQELIGCIEGNRYDTEARILLLSLREHKRVAQPAIPAIYHGSNESSHYRPLTDSLRIFYVFLKIVAFPELGFGRKGLRPRQTLTKSLGRR